MSGVAFLVPLHFHSHFLVGYLHFALFHCPCTGPPLPSNRSTWSPALLRCCALSLVGVLRLSRACLLPSSSHTNVNIKAVLRLTLHDGSCTQLLTRNFKDCFRAVALQSLLRQRWCALKAFSLNRIKHWVAFHHQEHTWCFLLRVHVYRGLLFG